MGVDWASIGVMLAVGGLLWRQIHALGGRVEVLAGEVRDVDRRLARLEGWIEGERVGRGASGDVEHGAGRATS